MRAPRLTTLLSGLTALGALAAAWYFLAPVALGGSTTYVVTSGVSMQPRFHSGDLVLVRSQSSYRVGEIAAYDNTMLHTIVLHRIVGRAGPAYLFKGDNNDFVDPDHPQRSQLIGVLWLHLAGAGSVLESLRSPLAVGALVGVGTLLLFGGAFTTRRRTRHRRAAAAVNPSVPQRTPGPRAPVSGLIAVAVIAILPFAALALPAFTRATTARFPVRIPYKQSGAFSYTAAAQPGPVYPGNRVLTGAPLFTRVLNAVDFRFAYAFDTAAAHSLTGTVGIYAIVTSTSGWQQTLTLARPSTFSGDHAVAAATLDLRSLTRLITAVQNATSVAGQYTLTLGARVRVMGSLGDSPLHVTYAPTLPFSLSQFELQRAGPEENGTIGAPGVATPLDPSMSGSVSDPRLATRFIALAFARITVGAARVVAIAGAAFVLLALAMALLAARRKRPDEAATIRARYGHAIVAVARVKRRRKLALIDVADMAALAQIAERYDRLILHEKNLDGEAFWVADESAQYRYVITAPARHGPAHGTGDQGAFGRWLSRRAPATSLSHAGAGVSHSARASAHEGG